MSPEISERAFEETIECALLRHGPDACPGDPTAVRELEPAYGESPVPGGYLRRRPEHYDRGLCLIPNDVLDFLLATQPKEWERLKQHHGSEVKPRFLGRLSREIGRRGTLDVLRNGVKDMGCKFRLAYFRPVSGLNQELQRLHAANLFAVVRQLRYSEQGEHSLDLTLFINGIPIFTAELKNPLNGQDVEDAIQQYKQDRDPREPLFANGRCLAHFAVDPELVFRDHPVGRFRHPIPALQPGALWGRGESTGATHPSGLSGRLPVGANLGSGQRARPHSPVSFTRLRTRTIAGARPAGAT